MADRERPQSWYRSVEQKGWILAGQYKGGEMFLAVRAFQVSLVHRWVDGERFRHKTIASFFGDNRFRRAKREAKAEMKAWERKSKR